jgi:hypothetical protein
VFVSPELVEIHVVAKNKLAKREFFARTFSECHRLRAHQHATVICHRSDNPLGDLVPNDK